MLKKKIEYIIRFCCFSRIRLFRDRRTCDGISVTFGIAFVDSFIKSGHTKILSKNKIDNICVEMKEDIYKHVYLLEVIIGK